MSQKIPDHEGNESFGVYTLSHFFASLKWHLKHRLLIGGTALSTLLPSDCALCGLTAPGILCEPCKAQFFQHTAQRCRHCALPTAAAPVCGACLRNPPAFDATIVAADYQAPIDQLVLALKFGAALPLASLFGNLIKDAMRTSLLDHSDWPDLLAPVPLGPKRLIERGYNQALEIARPLARSLTLPLLPSLLMRVRDTEAQAAMPAQQRHHNLRAAFVVTESLIETVSGQHVGVVDDVMTTGATLNELALTLKRSGARRVTNLVFARTPPR
ncbi:MAG: ComF family protein [Candidatus Paceibacteria bacterium]|jgi:ComF family protein